MNNFNKILKRNLYKYKVLHNLLYKINIGSMGL